MAKISLIQLIETFREIVYTFLSIVVVAIFTPFVILVGLPIYCFRLVVCLLSQIVRSDLTKILEARSTFLGVEDLYGSPNSTLLLTQIFEGELNKEKIIKEFEAALTIRRENGNLKYQQLSEYLVKWMGFLFWTHDKKFNLKNHIKYLSVDSNGQIINNSDGNESNAIPIPYSHLKLIEKELIKIPYKINQSPWQFLIVKNVQPKNGQPGKNYDAAIFKIHHCLADGYSVLKFFLIDLCKQEKGLIKLPEFPKTSSILSVFLNIYADIRAPFDIISHILWKPDSNAWHLPVEKLSGNKNFHLAESKLIPLENLKSIKKRHGVDFKTVIFAAITTSIRNGMLKRGLVIPQAMTCMCPFPFPGHPNKMGNYWSVMAVNLPVGITDPYKRMQFIQGHWQKLRHSTTAITSFKIQPLIGGLFHWVVKPLANVIHPTVLVSDFPGPVIETTAYGCTLVDVHFIGGFPPGNMGMLFFALSYNGNWKINVMVDHGIMSSDSEVEELVNIIMTEFSRLHADTVV